MSEETDEFGRTALHYAAFDEHTDQIHDLVAAGANVDTPDKRGWTPLHATAERYAVNAARVLLDLGASVDPRNVYGNTPLFVAVMNSKGSGELIELLLAHAADPDAANNYGQTPLGLAQLIANYDMLQFFPKGEA